MTPNGIECFECGEAAEGLVEGDECPNCASSNTGLVYIASCPNNVTKDDWLSGDISECNDDSHEWKSGRHIEPVQR